MDVAVFRFTLGIPGFEDRLIPRVVAGVGATLLGLNHILSIGMQVRDTGTSYRVLYTVVVANSITT